MDSVKREREGEGSDSDDLPLAAVVAKKQAAAAVVAAPSSDDDDVPLAQVVKNKKEAEAKAKKVVTTTKKVVKKEKFESSSDDVPLAKLAASKKREKDSDDDFKKKEKKVAAAPKKAAASSAKKPAKKKAKKEEEEEDDDKDDSSSEDIPLSQMVKKSAAKNNSSSKPKGERKAKKEEEEDVWEWWNEPPLPEGKRWRTLEHNGVIFPPEYEAHGVKMLYDGKPLDLSPEAEERATHYARYLEAAHTKKDTFNKNFFDEFKALVNKGSKKPIISDFSKCDFRPIKQYLDEEKEKKKNRTKEEKAAEKAEKKAIQDKYGYAMLDGHKQKVGNYQIEPPGLFLGRGNHPKAGTWKRRVVPEDVTINIGEGATPPPCPIPGHKWGEIVHKDTVTWLAGWQESIQGNFKYVMLSASSRTKGQSDMAKFDKARKLKTKIDEIRAAYTKDFTSSSEKERQRAVVVYLIDKLALRVGGEKDTENTADTVGCCSLRVEHVALRPPNSITLDFLGKDSMRYYNTVEIYAPVYKCIGAFLKGKKPDDQLFDEVTPSVVNDYLKEFMDGLSAKVFRTYNASSTLQRELAGTPENASLDEKVAFYNRANKQVALLCNHKRSLPPKYADSMKVLEQKIADLEQDLEDLKKHRKLMKAGKAPEPRSKDSEGNEKPAFPTDIDKIDNQISKLEERIAKENIKKRDKEDNAEVALGTSKINYNDPRITAAWCKKFDVPWTKVFSPALRAKFPWAQVAGPEWEF